MGGIESYAPDATVNSTGSTEFEFSNFNEYTSHSGVSNKWYLSLTFNDTRYQSTKYVSYNPEVDHMFQGWLSVEAKSSGQVCVYKLGGINATATGTANNGCDGVLSPTCIEFLRNATGSLQVKASEPCPSISTITKEAQKVCATSAVGVEFGTGKLPSSKSCLWILCRLLVSGLMDLKLTPTGNPIDVSNQNCTIHSPQQVSIPGGYRSYAVDGGGVELNETDTKASSFAWYDVHVEQTIP